ncbi:MAG TPA: Crp/Fnr family transcriptional regulator [Prolixibacteraceae bacterium]|nr:Crp/Fnr family transcriptional regulator [Prolixibacteraceae bacterium]
MSIKTDSVAERFIFKSDSAFSNLPDNVKEVFLSQMIVKQFRKKQNIFTEGTYPAGIYFIKKGKVKKYKSLNGGKEQIIYVCSEGELLGYAAFLSEEMYPDSAASLTDATIGFLSKDKLLKLLDQYDELSKMLMKNLSHEFGVLVNFIATFTQKTVRERVALTLLILQEKFKDSIDENNEIQINLTRADFANIVGTAVATLVRLLHDFKEENLIRTQGRKIIINNKLQLLEIADVADIF